jgi:hypothetical protein
MFMRGRQAAGAPPLADGLRQRANDFLQQAQRAERCLGALEDPFQSAVVEGLDGREALLKERRTAGRLPRGGVEGGARCGRELLQFGGGQFRDLADAVTGPRDVAQKAQSLDLLLGIQAAVGLGADRLNRTVALFPNPNDVRAQSGATGDDPDGIIGLAHS